MLRKLIHESALTYQDVAYQSGIPCERIKTIARGNAPMRVQEAAKIASVFHRSTDIFMDHNSEEDKTRFILTHSDEVDAFRSIYSAAQRLVLSYKAYAPSKGFKQIPKDAIYDGTLTNPDGTLNPISPIASHEAVDYDIIIGKTAFLYQKNSILLAGDNAKLIAVLTYYMRRWWNERIAPTSTLATYKSLSAREDAERKRRDIYQNICRLMYESEGFNADEFNPVKIEAAEYIAAHGLTTKIHDFKSAQKAYFDSLTALKEYEYYHCIYQINALSKKTDTLLSDSFEERKKNLEKFTPFEKTSVNLDEYGLSPITAGYAAGFHKHLNDTEFARIILEQMKQQNIFTWYISTDGCVFASNTITKIFDSMHDLAAAMRHAGFFAGTEEDNAKGIFWNKIPQNERAFRESLKS